MMITKIHLSNFILKSMAIMQVSTESTCFEFLWKFSPAIEMCNWNVWC